MFKGIDWPDVPVHLGYLDNLLAAVNEDGVDVRSYFGWTLVSILARRA
jgi:hypothetical protein